MGTPQSVYFDFHPSPRELRKQPNPVLENDHYSLTSRHSLELHVDWIIFTFSLCRPYAARAARVFVSAAGVRHGNADRGWAAAG
eukprot:scaffold125017_cov33-Tisochrysis_lutea.AAC.2